MLGCDAEFKAVEIATRTYAAIKRVAEPSSVYVQRADEIRQENSYEQRKVLRLVAVVQALRADLNAGYLQSLAELLHGELFRDFLDMAGHLVQSGYKDAAAVVAGSSLEAHLRQLANRNYVPIQKPNGEAKKADSLNADLVKAGAYSVSDQKSVTAWLDLRNNAAHGHYEHYEKDQVVLMIDSIRNFVKRHPA